MNKYNLALFLLVLVAHSSADDRVKIKMDTTEAESVVAVLHKRAAGKIIDSADWKRIFDSTPYIRLKKREASMHRDFTDDDFKKFVLSEALLKQAPSLQKTLFNWKRKDLKDAADRALHYLPKQAKLSADVYPVIKPLHNSFVFEGNAIFLYVDPEVSSAQFQNTVAHELHHIGLSSLTSQYDEMESKAPEDIKPVLKWISAFGEGQAVLAAAGSPQVHPMQDFKPADRIRWNQDMEGFSSNVRTLDSFFLDILRGAFKDKDAIDHVAFSFFGYRGPWYTVGYRMSTVVEEHFGREALINCMLDPRQLLVKYNQAAERQNANPGEHLPTWSPQLIQALQKEQIER
jgi:hypothetical protein